MSFNVPEGWEIVNLGQIVNKLQYGYTASASDNLTEIKFLRITDIQNRIVNWQTVPGCEISNDEYERYKLENGDFVFARTGSIEKAWLVVNAPKAVFASYLIRGKPLISEISPWLNKFIETLDYLIQIGAAGAGIGRNNVNAQNLSKIVIPLPLNEQKRIVTKIEVLQQRRRRAKTELEAIKPLLDQFRQSVLSAAFRGDLTRDWREKNIDIEPAEVLLERIKIERRRKWEETELEKMKAKGMTPKDDQWKDKYKEPESIDVEGLPELPKEWCWRSLETCFELERGRFSIRPRNDPSCYGGNYPFVQIGNLPRDGGQIKNYSQTLNEKGFSVSKMFFKGTVLIAIVGATIGNTGILEFDSCCPDSLVAIQCQNRELSKYIEYYFRLKKLEIRKVSYASGGQPNINIQTVKIYPFPITSYSEILEINKRIETLFKLADSMEQHYKQAANQLETLNQSILAKAFRGELVPQDPNDEPASVLLERIKAEKAKLEKPSKLFKSPLPGNEFPV